jgi:hypothetical protein
MMRGHWHKVIAVAVGGAIIVSLAINVSPWVLAAAALAIVWLFAAWRVKRALQLRSRGYFSGRMTEQSDYRWVWTYEERRGNDTVALELELDHVEPGNWELRVPAQDQWLRSVPGWASERRDEIIARIAESFPADRIRRDAEPKIV